jgi:choline-glycine betaine transporter
LIIGASVGFALTVLGFLPEAISGDKHDEVAAMIALLVSLPALLISGLLGFDFSIARLSTTMVFVSTITNMALLAAPFGLIGYYTRFFRGTRW